MSVDRAAAGIAPAGHGRPFHPVCTLNWKNSPFVIITVASGVETLGA
jgi:hypothetical protein